MKNLLELAKYNTVEYGSYTIMNRAIPDFRDGFKPVHRRILWAMYVGNYHSNGNFKKSANVIGDTMGKYHPHGDSGLYSSLVTLVNSPEAPIQGQGQWGSFRDPSRAAAPRYTEVRLSKYGEKFLLDPIYIKSAIMVDNYSGEHKEPLYLPAKVPNILVNGSEGIATACSNLIPSFSLDSVKELIVKRLSNELSIKDVANILKFKFTYGGKFIGDNLIEYLKTGKGSLYFIPEFDINLDENLIALTSASPRFNLEKFMIKVSSIKDIKSVDDLSSGDSINIAVYTKNIDKRAKKELIVKIKELAVTSLPCNTLITRRSEEKTAFRKVSIIKLIDLWLEWRKAFEKKVVKRLLQEEDQKLKAQELIRLAIENRQVIKDSMEAKDPENYVSSKLKISLEDSNKILAFPIRKLAKVEIGKINSTIDKINSDINFLKTTKIEKRVERSL